MFIKRISFKSIILIVVLILPLIFSISSLSNPVSIKDIYCEKHTGPSKLFVGDFTYFNVTVNVDAEKVCIIAYHGNSIPPVNERNVGNYYRWEYKSGIWQDNSSHDSKYIKPDNCEKNNNNYSFFIKIDNKVKPGKWTVKILIDDEEVEDASNSYIIISQLNVILTAIIGIYEPIYKDKKTIADLDIFSSEKKRIMDESKDNIDNIVDEVLRRNPSRKKDDNENAIDVISYSDVKPFFVDESIKTSNSNYQKSKLRIKQNKFYNSILFNKNLGGGIFFNLGKKDIINRFFTIFFTFILLTFIFMPTINTQDMVSSNNPIISSFSVYPENVNPNETVLINVTASDTIGIKNISLYFEDVSPISLYLKDGSIINDTTVSGFWQSSWKVQNIDPGIYTFEVFIFNTENRTVSKKIDLRVLNSIDININSPNNNMSNNNISNEYRINHNNDNETKTKKIDNSPSVNSNHSSISQNENLFNDYTNITNFYNQNPKTVFIVDKKHEELSILPGTRFYVDRTIDGIDDTSVVFAPMFSDALTLEYIEIIDKKEEKTDFDKTLDRKINFKVFEAGKGICNKEKRIESHKEVLPAEVRDLNKIGYIDNFKLQSPRTIRMWFRAPEWDEIQSNPKNQSGEISYLLFSDDINESYDFEGSTWWNMNWLYRKNINVTTGGNTPYNGYNGYTVRFTGLDTSNESKFQTDGDDIRILYYNGLENLELDREILNPGTINTTIIFKLQANISANSYDNNYSIYYGNNLVGEGPTNQSNIYLWYDSATIDRENEYIQGRVDASAHGGSWADSISWDAAGYYTFDTANDYADSFRPTGLNERDVYIEFEEYQTGAYTTDMTSGPLTRWDGTGSGSSEDSSHWYNYEVADSAYQGGSYSSHDDITADDRGSEVVTYGVLGTFPQTTWTRLGLASWSVNPTNLKAFYNNESGGWNGSRFSGTHDASNDNENPGQFGLWLQQDAGRVRNIIARRYVEPEPVLIIGNEEIDTSIDKISPYNVTYSPYVMTATGPIDLDNVTMWYRFSIDNNSWDDWTENEIDVGFPWQWNFNFPNGTGYYEFYSLGILYGAPEEFPPLIADAICYFNASINTPPEIDLINPAPNGTTEIIIQPNCQIWANDSDGDSLNVYWYENTTGNWVLRNTNLTVTANSSVSFTYNQFDTYSTKFWWKVAANDSTDNTSVVYSFITTAIETSVDTIIPESVTTSPKSLTATGNSGLDNVKLYYRWSKDNLSWETKTISIFEGFESGVQNTSLWTLYQSPGDTRTQFDYGTVHSGSYSCVMDDDDTDLGDSELNEIYTVYDFSGSNNINVEFWHADSDDEANPSPASWDNHGNYDAVSFTNDGTTWYELFDTDTVPDLSDNSGSISWEGFSYNISNHPSFNPSVNGNFAIKFQQYDDYNLNPGGFSDGRLWDDIYINFTVENENGSDWIEWTNASNPDTGSPWGWNFDFPNGTGYYEFYSIGNISGSLNETAPDSADARCYYNPEGNPPTIQLINPSPNGTTDIQILPNCKIWANDSNGDLLTIDWYENTTGSWILRNTNSSVSADSIVSYTYTEFSNLSTTYWWKVTVNDSKYNTSAEYFFTTESIETYVNSIIPYDQTVSPLSLSATGPSSIDNVTLWYRYSDDNSSWESIPDWWDANWSFRKLITVNSSQVDSDLNNFPILLNITDTDLRDYAKDNGDDIAFVLFSDNSTQLNHEIEFFDEDSGELLAWINVTSLSSSDDTKIWMFYNNSESGNQQNPGGVWDSNYLAVWHLDESGIGTRFDSTSYGNHGVTSGYDGDEAVAGYIDGADDFDGNNDYIDFQDNFMNNLDAFTLEGWIKPDGWGNRISLFGQNDVIEFFLDGSNDVDLWTDGGGSTSATYSFNLDTWHHVVGIGDGSNLRLYFDGSEVSSGGSSTSDYGSSSYNVQIGEGVVDASGGEFDGTFDEVRISNINRGVGWITTSYNNQNDISSFLYLGDGESKNIWTKWTGGINPDENSPWGWEFDFPNSTGYYEFYSIGKKLGVTNETPPSIADAICYYEYTGPVYPVINGYDLMNSSGSKLNNATGLLDVNEEYYFTVNITDSNGWTDIEFINITAWYDSGNEDSVYNQTQGGNLNMYLQYENVTGTANFSMLWPDDEVQLIVGNCTETIITMYTRIIKISFKPLSQIRWASSNGTWDGTQNTTNDAYSWNFNISVTDHEDYKTWINDEYGLCKYTSHSLNNDWVGVYTAPGFSDTSNIVTITFSSNYDFNMSLFFEENLYNSTYDVTIPIANNVEILASTDPNDDIVSDITFSGIGEVNAVDIFNDSGIFHVNNVSQTVQVQFNVFIPLGTLGVKYRARVATKVIQN